MSALDQSDSKLHFRNESMHINIHYEAPVSYENFEFVCIDMLKI